MLRAAGQLTAAPTSVATTRSPSAISRPARCPPHWVGAIDPDDDAKLGRRGRLATASPGRGSQIAALSLPRVLSLVVGGRCRRVQLH